MKLIIRSTWCAVAGVVIGCGGGGGGGGGTDAAAPVARTLTVHGVMHVYSASGESTVVLGNAVSSAQSRDAAGKFHGLDVGTVDAHGDFTIPVDDGQVYLQMIGDFQFPGEIVVDPVDPVDIGSLHAGRTDALGPGAPFSLGGDGLLPWRIDDQLIVVCPNIEATRFPGTQPATGATTFGPTRVDDLLPAPVSAARGDALWILQQRRDVVDGVTYRHVERALALPSLEQTAGVVADATGTFVAPPTAPLDLDVRLSQFAALPGVDPDHLGAKVTVLYRPFGIPQAFGTVEGDNELAGIDLAGVAGDKQLALSLGNPFPAGFPIIVALDIDTPSHDYARPNTPPLLFAGSLHIEAPLAEAEAAPLVPRIGLPSALLVDGAPAGPDAHPSLTPTLSWQAPALGQATGFAVDLIDLLVSTDGRATLPQQVTRLFTRDLQVVVPPGMLAAGHTYFFMVTALAGGIDVRAAPHKATGAYAASRTLSDPFTL